MRSLISLTLGTLLVLAGCGSTVSDDPSAVTPSAPGAACTDPVKCCTQDKMICTGDPDEGLVCHCSGLWDCSKNPAKCEQAMPTPTGGGTWTCTWAASSYTCTSKGSKSSPPGGSGWSCSWVAASSSWSCTATFPPNPSNSPEGGAYWQCSVDNESDKVICDKQASPSPTPTPTPQPAADAGVPPTKPAADAGKWPTKPSSDAGTPTKPASDAAPAPTPKPGQQCVPGQKKWCDGEIYCGWGQTTCLSTGKWDPKCVEQNDGRVPNTACACYHYYFEPSCCETPDCVIPAGQNGQICSYGSGKLCDPCNPNQPNCTEPGGKCMVLAGGAFCTKGCTGMGQGTCPTGYTCMMSQCVPQTWSCQP